MARSPRPVFTSSAPEGQTTRAYDWPDGQRIAVGAASAQSAAIDASEVMLRPSGRCFVKVGANPTAANAAGSIPLEAGESFHLQLSPGDKVAAIRDTADSFLYILPVA
jgi:hypothetical protein